jgi:alkylation response protein AidB-like acyl-CoA dehydrogenase
MLKLFLTETARKAALEGMQMMGGYGYSSEYDMERLVRQTLVATIYGGTSPHQPFEAPVAALYSSHPRAFAPGSFF